MIRPLLNRGAKSLATVALTLLAAAAPRHAQAQQVVLKASNASTLSVAPGTKFAVPVIVDITNAGAVHIASFQTGMTWGSGRLTLDSLRTQAGTDFSVTPNLANAASGSIVFNAFAANNITATQTVTNAWFTAGAVGGTRIAFQPSAAGDELAANILASLIPSGLDVCVATPGKWGDVNDDANVNIIDAQQIARFSVGLSVANAAALSARGDVTADGNVNIIDAQQIARFSVALSASARINTNLFTPPTVASIALTPNTPQNLAVGATTTLVAAPKDAGNVDLTGCAQVTWSSTNPAIATVNAGGTITGIANGTTTITATSVTQPGVTASISVTVGTGGGSTGINVAVTSPFGGSRYFVIVDSGGLAGPTLVEFDALGSKTPTIPVTLPAGTGYRVRVLARDTLFGGGTNSFPNVGAGIRLSNVTVTTGAMTPVTATLGLMTSTLTMSSSIASGTPLATDMTLVDPSELFANSAASPFFRLGWASWTTDLTNTFTSSVGTITQLSVTSRRYQNLNAYTPVQGGTLFVNATYQAPAINGINFQFTAPASFSRPGESLRQVAVSGATEGIQVSITSPISVTRYMVMVDTGNGGGTPIVTTFASAGGTTANIQVPAAVRAGTGYRVRAVAVDSTGISSGSLVLGIRAGARRTGVLVTAGSFTPVALTLLPASSTTPVIPSTASVNTPIPVSMTVTDSSQATNCSVRTSATAFASIFAGAGHACSFGAEGVGGTRTLSGTIAGQPVGTIFARVYAANGYQLPDGRFTDVGFRPAGADPQIVVSAPTTGINVSVTSPFGASRYFVLVDSGGLASPIVLEWDASNSKTPTIPVTVPVGTGYRVRVLARDTLQLGNSNFPNIGAGLRISNVAVTAGALTAVPATLGSITATTTLPSSISTGTALVTDMTLVDPSEFFVNTTTPFYRLGFAPWTTDLTNTFTVGAGTTVTNISPSSRRWQSTSAYVPVQVGTLYLEAVHQAVAVGGFNFQFHAPSPVTRAEALKQVSVTAAAEGIAVSITSPVAVGRYLVLVDSGNGGGPIIVSTVVGAPGTTANIQVPAAVRGGSGYRVRAVALDSSSFASNLLFAAERAGARRTGVQVVAGSFTPVSLTLLAAGTSSLSIPAAASAGVFIPVSLVVTDSSQAAFCTVRWSTAAFTTPNSGSSGTCVFSTEGVAGVRTLTGQIPAQAAGANIFARVYSAGQYGLPDGRQVEVSLRPNVADAQIPVTAATTGVRLNITSPRAVQGYVVVVDSGGLTQQAGFRFFNFSRTPQLVVPLVAGSNYRVRVFGSDSIGNILNVSTSFRASNVNVAGGALTDVSATLAPMTMTWNEPASLTPNLPFTPDITLTDNASLFTAPLNVITPPAIAPGNFFCPTFQWSMATFADFGGTQVTACNRTVINATQERFTGPNIVPTVTGTLFFQSRIAANVFLDGQLQALTWLQPSTSRQEPLNQLPVTAPATTMTVNITSPVAVSRFVVIADTGAGQPIVLLQNGTGMTSGSVVVPAYASTKWRVRVAATDSTGVNGATLLSFMPASGIASSITVAATGNVVVPVTLSQFSSTWAMAATGTVAGQVAMSGGVTDPGFITTSCFARWTMAAFTTPTSGTLVACSFGVPSGATRAVSGFVSPNATGTLSTKLILNGSYILTDGRTIELDIVPAIATSTIGAALAVDLVGNGFANWWNANMDPNLLGMSVTADEVTSSFGNFGMRWNGQQPRIAFGNGAALAPSGVSDETTALTPWNRLYGSLYTVNLGLKQLANGEVVSGGATPTEAAKALGDFLWAANLGTVATLYDKAYIPRDSNTFNLALKPYTEVRDSALARFDAMIAVASGKSWVIDPKYTFDLASGSLTGDVLARMARSLAARTLAQSARNASQNTATDWARVLAYAQSGISSIGGSGMDISASATTSNPLGNDYQAYVNSSSWTRVDGRVIHAMDPTQPLFWTSTTAPAQATSPDARLGTDFGFSGVQPFDPARGTYFLGSWFYKRTAYLSLDGGGGFVGLASQMRVAENDLLVAEAMIRSGGSLTSAASLVNKTRVGRGGLPAVLVSGVPISANCLPKAADGTSCGTLLDAVMYERLIELYGSNVAVGWGDARRTDVVPAGTPRSLPVPASIMTGKGLTPYTFGGAGLDGSTPAP